MRSLGPIALNNCSRGSDVNWLRSRFDSRPDTLTPGEESLVRLGEAGTQVVLFISECRAGSICETSRQLEGGRIPIKLAETTPLNECSNPDGCACCYEAWLGSTLAITRRKLLSPCARPPWSHKRSSRSPWIIIAPGSPLRWLAGPRTARQLPRGSGPPPGGGRPPCHRRRPEPHGEEPPGAPAGFQ